MNLKHVLFFLAFKSWAPTNIFPTLDLELMTHCGREQLMNFEHDVRKKQTLLPNKYKNIQLLWKSKNINLIKKINNAELALKSNFGIIANDMLLFSSFIELIAEAKTTLISFLIHLQPSSITHSRFLIPEYDKAINLSKKLLKQLVKADNANIFNKKIGINLEYLIGWISDKDGIIPFYYTPKEGIFQSQIIVNGNFNNFNHKKVLIYENNIIEQPGIFIKHTLSNQCSLYINLYMGAENDFQINVINQEISSNKNSQKMKTLKNNTIANILVSNQTENANNDYYFYSLPQENEVNHFEAYFIEHIAEVLENESNTEQAKIYCALLASQGENLSAVQIVTEKNTHSENPSNNKVANINNIEELNQEQNSIIENIYSHKKEIAKQLKIEAEKKYNAIVKKQQEQVTKQVIENKHERSNQAATASFNATKTNKEENTQISELDEKKLILQNQLNKELKKTGMQKWKSFISLLDYIMNDLSKTHNLIFKKNIVGSHIIIHPKIENKSGKSITIVRPHNHTNEIYTNIAKSLGTNIINIAIELVKETVK